MIKYRDTLWDRVDYVLLRRVIGYHHHLLRGNLLLSLFILFKLL
jgi:hypothetical protein